MRVFLEIGAGNGIHNNTAFLLAQGWSGFWIDADDLFIPVVEAYKAQGANLHATAAFVNKDNVVNLLQQIKVPDEFDLLSIDIDQNTFYVWEALRNYSPRVVVIEYNAAIPAPIEWKCTYVPDRMWDGTINYGASLKALEVLGFELGYALVGCDFTGTNAFFIRNDLVDGKFATPYTAENHYEPPRYQCLNYHHKGHRAASLDRQSA